MALTPQERLRLANALTEFTRAEAAAAALRYSYARRPVAQETLEYTESDWERLDALTVRFARLADLLTQRVWRAIERVEFDPPDMTFLDRLARAEKRGLAHSAYVWKEIRELRNEIVHEYATSSLGELLKNVVKHTPELLAAVTNLQTYKQTFQTRLKEDAP